MSIHDSHKVLPCSNFKLAKPQSVISQIQAEEERVLMAAIQEQKLKRLSTPDMA